ncbi:MAG: hypothetical protein WBY75_11335 [Terracidiphilus sp.]
MAKHFSLAYLQGGGWLDRALPACQLTLTVSFGNEQMVEDDAHQIYRETLAEFKARYRNDPTSASRFMEQLEKERETNVDKISDLFEEVKKRNQHARDWLLPEVKTLIIIKCAATIAWKTGGEFIEGFAFFFVDLGYDIALEVIREWDNVKDAQLTVMVEKGGDLEGVRKAAKDDTVQMIGEKGSEALAQAAENRYIEAFKDCFKGVEKLGEKEALESMGRNLSVFNRMNLTKAVKLGLHKKLADTVKVLFWYKNVKAALKQAEQEWGEAH